MTIRATAFIMCVLDAAGWAFAAIGYFGSGPDPSAGGFEHAAGVIVTVLFVITVLPAIVLTLTNRMQKTALTLAVAFPAVIASLLLTFM